MLPTKSRADFDNDVNNCSIAIKAYLPLGLCEREKMETFLDYNSLYRRFPTSHCTCLHV